ARTRSAGRRRSEVADGGQAAAGKAAHPSHTAATGRPQHRPKGRPPGVAARTRLHPRRFASQGLTHLSPMPPVGAQHAAPLLAITSNSRMFRRTTYPAVLRTLYRLPATLFSGVRPLVPLPRVAGCKTDCSPAVVSRLPTIPGLTRAAPNRNARYTSSAGS